MRFKQVDTRLPFVLVNMSMTADGKIASANRAVSSFSSAHDHRQLLRLRSGVDAVICGARTVDLNRINLGPGPSLYRRLRLRRGLDEYNLRIIVSGSGSIDPEAEIFRHRFSPIIILTTERAPRAILERLSLLVDEVKICGRETVDFVHALRWLREKHGVRRLLCEGGGELNAALFSAGLVHELNLTICPRILGGSAAPTITDGTGAFALANAAALSLKSMKRVGDELFVVYDVLPSPSPSHGVLRSGNSCARKRSSKRSKS